VFFFFFIFFFFFFVVVVVVVVVAVFVGGVFYCSQMGRFSQDPSLIVNGLSILDPSRVFYWGISQGGILVSALIICFLNDKTQKLKIKQKKIKYTSFLRSFVTFSHTKMFVGGGGYGSQSGHCHRSFGCTRWPIPVVVGAIR
jgi:hypothetical protein